MCCLITDGPSRHHAVQQPPKEQQASVYPREAEPSPGGLCPLRSIDVLVQHKRWGAYVAFPFFLWPIQVYHAADFRVGHWHLSLRFGLFAPPPWQRPLVKVKVELVPRPGPTTAVSPPLYRSELHAAHLLPLPISFKLL